MREKLLFKGIPFFRKITGSLRFGSMLLLFFLMISPYSFKAIAETQQGNTGRITGVVRDDAGEELIGVSVW